MKNNPALKGLILSLIMCLMAFGVYFLFLKKDNSYIVDNPTNNTFYFKINNGSEKIISAGQSFPVQLNKGKNSIKVYDKDKKELYDSAFQVTQERGLLNIAHQDYYINRQYYGYGINKDSLLLSTGKTMIDGKEYYGGPTRVNKLYSEDFYFNINEDYDKLIKNVQKVESRTKIFRKENFINYHKEYYKF